MIMALAVLSDSGTLKYLEENYDVIHTQSHHWILADIEELSDGQRVIQDYYLGFGREKSL